jgi:hypothetical protein
MAKASHSAAFEIMNGSLRFGYLLFEFIWGLLVGIFFFSFPEKADHVIDVIFHGPVGSVGVTPADGLINGLVLFQDLDDVTRIFV